MARRIVSPLLIGRDGPLAALDAGLAAAGDGRPSLTFVSGEAGVGKTRLLREAESRAAASGSHVLRGECLGLSGGEYPYAPLVAALRRIDDAILARALEGLPTDARNEVALLVPGAVAPQAEGSRRRTAGFSQGRLFELLLALLRNLGEPAPLLFVIEDAHLADSSTRDFLAFVARNLTDERIALVVTYRSDELRRDHPLRVLLGELIRVEGVERLQLERLGRGDIERQVEAILGASPPHALVDELFGRSDGNPFFVEELLAGQAAGDSTRLPERLRDALLVRVESLPDGVVAVLRVLGAFGRPVPQKLLEAVAGIDGAALSQALRLAVEDHIVFCRAEDDTFAFRHALVREAVWDDLLPGERVALHRSIAEALLQSTPANPAELAFHWECAGEHGAALGASVSAGLEAERVYAFAEAREHFERALRLWTEAEPPGESLVLDQTEVRLHAAQAARLAGDWDRAVALSRQALEGVDAVAEPLRAATLYEHLAQSYLWDEEAALAAYTEALRVLPEGFETERARLLGAKALRLQFQFRWDAARACGEEALDVAMRAGAELEAAYAHLSLGLTIAFLGDPDGAEAHLREAKAAAERLSWPEGLARVYAHLAEVERIRNRLDEALALTLDGVREAERMGLRNSFGRALSAIAAQDLFRLGRWDEALEQIHETRRLKLGFGAQLIQHSLLGRLAVSRGDFDEARTQLESARAMCDDRTPVEYLVAVYAGWAELALWESHPDEAAREVDDALAGIGERTDPLYTPVLFSLGLRACADAAAKARATSREDEYASVRARAEELLRDLDEIVARHSLRVAPASALVPRALARGELSRLRSGSAADWDEAVEAARASADPYCAAYAQFRRAEALLAVGGQRAAAAADLASARAVALQLGAEPLLSQVGALGRAARLTLPAELQDEVGRPDAADNVGLTRRELDVLALVADGLTNREIAKRLFISDRTVGVHVSNILAKLGAGNRLQAVGVANRLGLLEAVLRESV